jgi:uncharacterized membrane protein YccC
MADAKFVGWWRANQRELIHAVRTTVAAVVSLLMARLFGLPESYWAAITTIVVLQSTLGAAWTISKQRFAGTALGAFVGALLASYLPGSVTAFGAGVLLVGIVCALLHIERNAYRYAGITVAIVVLIPHTAPAWAVGLHRFIEISIGIAVGLALTAVWPESPVRAPAPATE